MHALQEKGDGSRWLSGCEDMTAVITLQSVKDVFIHDIAHASARHGTGSATEQATKERACQTAQNAPCGTREGTEGGTRFGSR